LDDVSATGALPKINQDISVIPRRTYPAIVLSVPCWNCQYEISLHLSKSASPTLPFLAPIA